MAVKEESFVILDDEDDASRLLITDVVESSLFLNDNKSFGVNKHDVCVLPERNSEQNIIKKHMPLSESGNTLAPIKTKISNEYFSEYSFNCAVCQNVCVNCKNICVTCKAPCRKCAITSFKSSFTDTDDFEKYLESHTRKIKIQPKVKTIGTDTCDLEGHFDYYNLEKKTIRIQKTVATDCIDLNARILIKKPAKSSIAVDTSDLINSIKHDLSDESDCEFVWTKKQEAKTYCRKLNVDKSSSKTDEKHCEGDISDNSVVIDEDALGKEEHEEDMKESINCISNCREITFDTTSSDESDIDLITSSKVAKCRKLAKKHKITLKQINGKEISFKCNICGKTFPEKYLGILHLGSHVESNKVKCLTCSQKFQSIDLLFLHVKDEHSDKSCESKKFDVKVEGENKENHSNKKRVNKIYKCDLCLKENEPEVKFNSFKSLYLHKKLKHGISNEAKVEKKTRIKREFVCLLCGKQFKSSKALKDHAPVHTGEKNYHCDICNKSYTTSANLKIHKRTHTGAKNFVCTVCNKAFHKKDSLKVHFRKHSGERPFQCDLCPMKFDRNYILKNHRYTHFSEKTFICPVCGKTFTTHGGLNNHEKSHKKDPLIKKPRKPAVKPTLDAENAVICDVCGKIYSTRSNLRLHKFVHLGIKPYECTICHQTYAKKDSMLTHMRKHTDERPFACETCGMTFYRNHTLKTHLLRHTGERPHKCKMCGKSFTQSSSLAYHVKNHDKKIEKKKVSGDETLKQKKKRNNQSVGKSDSANPQRTFKNLKTDADFPSSNKGVFEESDKKPVTEITVIKDPVPVSVQENENPEFMKGGHFMLPIPEKEILILDKNLGVEIPKSTNPVKEDFFGLEKDVSYNNQCNLGKFNYYIAKSHVFSFPKDTGSKKEIEISIEKNDVENLIISKNSYITKEGNLVTLNRDTSLKDVKDEFVEIENQRLDLKGQTAIPITGEILNATFISDENGDVIPFTSMTLQGLNSENVMVSPLISVEGSDRKGFVRNPKLTILDPKITGNLCTPRLPTEKSSVKSCHVINLKDARVPQKIHIELEAPALNVQSPVVDDGALHGISGFYNNIQQNEL